MSLTPIIFRAIRDIIPFIPLLAATIPAQALPITVANSSFENQVSDLTAGASTNQLVNWTGTNGNNDAKAFMEWLGLAGADGTDTLGMELGYDVWQDLGSTYVANQVYTLTVALGNRDVPFTVPGNQSVYALADSTGTIYATATSDASTQAPGTFADAPQLTFNTASNPAAVGKTIRILLQARGAGRSHWDNIRLDGPATVRATVTTSAATVITTTTAQLNGTITNTGGGVPTAGFYYGPVDGLAAKAAWASNVSVPGAQSGAFSQAIAGLQPGTPYYYRALANNTAGDAWSSPSRTFTTSIAPPTVANIAASAIGSSSAVLGASLTSTGGESPTLTVYYGPSDGGSTAASWTSNVSLVSQIGSATSLVTGLGAGTTYFFRAKAVNSAGTAWAPSSGSFTTLGAVLPTVVNKSPTGVTQHDAKLHGTVTATGGEAPMVTIYWGVTDGGTTPGNWQHAASQGYQANDFGQSLTGLAPATIYYHRCAATNGAGTAWAPGSSSFATSASSAPQVENKNANGVTASTAVARGTITNDGGSPVTVTFYWGTTDGGAAAANWQHTLSIGTQTNDYSCYLGGLSANTTYFFRSAGTNATGSSWSPATTSFTTSGTAAAHVVINEIHYRRVNTQETKSVEFIEIYNPTALAVNMAGWHIDGGVSYLFPGAGTTIAANGFLVIAQNLTDFTAKFPGVTALGPWTGQLKSSADTVTLINSAGAVIDEVNYQSGFPWPTMARGGGSSMERVHWSLDPNLGGSWRSSGFSAIYGPGSTQVPLNDSQWHWRKGLSEASTPVGDWRLLNFVEDASWEIPGVSTIGTQAPFGFNVTGGNVTGVNTQLPDMQSATRPPGYSCLFMRRRFSLAGALPSQLKLQVFVDDGAVVWINGTEVARVAKGAAGAAVAFTDNAAASTISTTPQVFTLLNATAYLVPGDNVIAVQAFNVLLNNSDFKIDVELTIPAGSGGVGNPTPGATNTATSSVAPPAIRQVGHSPVQPTGGQPVAITAKITDPDGIGSVQLQYQTVDPGAYIRKTDATYLTNWTPVAMVDDGTQGDAVAGDSIFTAVLPGTLQTHRRLVRYRIMATDTLGNLINAPYSDDEQPNFAYFCYDGVPAWSGAMRPTAFSGFPATPVQTFSSELLNSLPPHHLIANATDVTNSQYNSGSDGVAFPATLVYDGVVYDHMKFKNRGIGSTYVSGKNKWNLFFNRARDFQARDDWGRKYSQTWNNMPIDANACPWASVHRGAAGVEEALSYRAFELAGVNSLRTHYIHYRVITTASETGATQYDGDFWGLYLGMEPTEGNFLDERSLPDGNLYAIEGGGGDKKHQGATQPADASDWNTFHAAIVQTGQSEAYYRANEDLPNLYSFIGMGCLVGNVDVRPGDNYRYYHRPTDNRWLVIPYDLDMQFIPAFHWGGTMDGIVVAGAPDNVRAMMRYPSIALEFRNRCRELLSLIGSDGSPNGGQIGQLIDEYAQMVNPAGLALTWADADAAKWNLNTRTAGSGTNSGQSSHRGNFFRAVYNDGTRGGLGGTTQTGTWIRRLSDPDNDGFSDHEGLMQWFVNYSTNTFPGTAAPWVRKATNSSGGGTDNDVNRQKGYGYKYLEWQSLYGGYFNCNINPATAPDISYPNLPTISYTGAAGYAANNLTFQSSAFSPSSSGGTTFAAMQWRLGEISAPGTPFYDPTQPRIYEIQPLWDSGELTVFNATTRIPASAVRTGHTYRARVRHKDANGRWSLWSAPAQFIAGEATVGVYVENLAITEVNFHPGAATAAEVAAGFSTDDFEFIELKNVGTSTLDLTDVRFTKGVDVDIAAGTTLAGGGFALVVKNPTAFQMRYGHSHDSQIVGTYPNDSLSNGGEEIKLSYGQGEPIIDFVYDDVSPWPSAADGNGYTLVLKDAASHPDHALASSWRASCAVGGSPGADDLMTFACWTQNFPGVTNPNADNDGDGVVNLLEYAFGGDPLVPSVDVLPKGGIASVVVGANPVANYLIVAIHRPTSISDLTYTTEFSTDLAVWTGGAVLVSSVDNGDGTVTEFWRSPNPVNPKGHCFGHVRVQ